MTAPISVTQALAMLFALLAFCGCGYIVLSIFAIFKWRSASHPTAGTTPGISILKSLRGTDRAMYEAFRSHCLQDYPEFEMIFGVGDMRDEAVAEVERLQREFPHAKIKLIECTKKLGANGKVSTLAQLVPHANYDILLINDSDITVQREYLRRVAAEFQDAKVGLVTALYRAEAATSLASKLEALTVATDFAAGVLTARVVEGGVHFALGSTMAVRREVLEKIDGLAAIVDYLADDYELGARTSAAGYRVALADTVVETHLPSYGFGGMLQHQLRWARTIRDRRVGGYIGLIVTYALPWALLTVLASKLAIWSLIVLATAAVLRVVQASLLCTSLCDRPSARRLLLLPLRDVFALYVWIVSFFGNTVVWRGLHYRVRGGKITPA